MQFSWKNPLKALPVLLVLAAYAGTVFGAAGNVQFVIGDVKLVTKARETRALQKGAEINEGDRIITGASSSAQIKMVDGGFIAVRPNTDMGFDTYRYNGKEDGSENAVVSLLQGGFRTITGVIGRTNKHNYHIKTETATIGIRGTDHEPMVIRAPAPGQVAIAEPGTYDKVNVGVAFIQTDAGSVDIQQNQVGFAPVTKAAPVILPKMPPFYKPTPAPGPQQAKEESKEGGQQETAAAAPGEKAAEVPAAIRDTAVVDPTSTVFAAPAVAAVASAPAILAPVIAVTAAGATGDVLNTTTQTTAIAGGTEAPTPITPSAAYPVATPVGAVVVVSEYSYLNGTNPFSLNAGGRYWVDKPSASLVTDSAGNLISIAESNTAFSDDKSLKLSGGTATPATPTALSIGSATTATDGHILLGWIESSPNLTVSGNDWNGCFGTGCAVNPTPRTVLGDGVSWVRGPAPFPAYLPGAIADYSNSSGMVVNGTASYNLGASILHDKNGATGTVNSAGLTVDFNKASVNFDMQATTAAGTWVVAAPGIRLDQGGTFRAHAGNTGTTTITSGTTVQPTNAHDTMSLTLTGSASTFGNIEGQLMGIGVGGAGVTYNLNGFLPCTPGPCPNVTAAGALAFGLSGTPYSTLTPYYVALNVPGMTAAGEFNSKENTRIDGGFLSAYRTQFVNNYPVKLDGELPVVVTNGTPCTINCMNITNLAVVYAVAGATGAASIGTASLVESGFDLVTGIRWGRYGNGTIGVTDRISGASLGTVDASVQGVPFIFSANQPSPTVLPTSGTFNYTFVGGTAPIDSTGNVGAALTAANASLTANFTAQTVDATLSNIVVGGNTWGASATAIPIGSNVFQAEKKLGATGGMTVTSSLGTNTAGRLVGGFTGPTGGGVGMAYSLNHGGNKVSHPAAVTVSGVAAFRR